MAGVLLALLTPPSAADGETGLGAPGTLWAAMGPAVVGAVVVGNGGPPVPVAGGGGCSARSADEPVDACDPIGAVAAVACCVAAAAAGLAPVGESSPAAVLPACAAESAP